MMTILKQEMNKILRSDKGFSLFEMMITLTIVVIIGAMIQINYRNYKTGIEKELHLVNVLNYVNVVKQGVLEGWVVAPSDGHAVQVSFQTIQQHVQSLDLLNPSSVSKDLYDSNSKLQIYNNAGKLEFFVQLKDSESDHFYVDTVRDVLTETTIEGYLLKRTDIQLP